MKRRAFLGAHCASAVLASGCDFSLRDGVFNQCLEGLPPDLREHPLVQSAWKGIDSRKAWDTHCHVFGDGDSGSGLWVNPRLDDFWRPLDYAQRAFYANASCTDNLPGRTDKSFAERLLADCREMAPGFPVLPFAFDWARDDAGKPMLERSSFYVPDSYVAKLVELGLPLINHAGNERAVDGSGEHLGNPLRLRRALDTGVRVVAAHCASLGEARIDEAHTTGQTNFDLFSQLMDEPRFRGHPFGDLSAVTQVNRMDVLATLLERQDWHGRLLNGSDYPLPGVVPLVSPRALADRKLLAESAVGPLIRLRNYNVLLFDFVLKRSVSADGRSIAPSVFETAPFFAKST